MHCTKCMLSAKLSIVLNFHQAPIQELTLAFPFCSILVLIYLDNKKEYISIGWMEKVTDLSIFLPSYIRDKDICLMLGL